MKEKEIFALEYEITKTDGNTKQYVYNRETDSFADKTDSYGKETLFTKKELKDFLESLSPENPLWTSIVFPIYAVKTDGTGSVKERTPITGHDTYAKNEYLADALTLMPSRMFDSKDVLEAQKENTEDIMDPRDTFLLLRDAMKLIGNLRETKDNLENEAERNRRLFEDDIKKLGLLSLDSEQTLHVAAELKEHGAKMRAAQHASSAISALFEKIADVPEGGTGPVLLAFAKTAAEADYMAKDTYRLQGAEGTVQDGILYMDADFPEGIPDDRNSGQTRKES